MSKYLMNRLANCKNPYQGTYKKVLCVCSAGLLRSPTAAVVLSKVPYNYNTRAAGLEKEFALIPVGRVLLTWADEVVCMTKDQQIRLQNMLKKYKLEKSVLCLNIEDSFPYRERVLVKRIKDTYWRLLD